MVMHTNRILCTECREEFVDTGMVAAHTCSACDAIAMMRVTHKRFPWLVGTVLADHGATATVQWDQHLPNHWAMEAWHDLRATPVQPKPR